MVLSLEDIDQHADARCRTASPRMRRAARERFYVEVLAAVAALRSKNGELALVLALLSERRAAAPARDPELVTAAEIH